MKGFQFYLYPLKSVAFTAGGEEPIGFDTIPKRIFGRIAHLAGFLIDFYSLPALTTAPTTQLQHHSVINNIVFNDGKMERYNSSFYNLRQFELLERGNVAIPEPDAAANGAAFNIKKFLPVGPYGSLAGGVSDFLLPVASLSGGELRYKFGALTDFSADTTAQNTSRLQTYAVLCAMDKELRIGPALERKTIPGTSTEIEIKGRALLLALGLIKSSSHTAWTADTDLKEISLETAHGNSPGVLASSLTAMAHFAMRSGQITKLEGELRGAAADNAKDVNLAAPTALVASLAALQPVVSIPEGLRISKVMNESIASLKVKWTGTYGTAPIALATRILASDNSVYADYAAKAIDELKMREVSAGIKTLSKKKYEGPRREFMPRSIRIA